MSEYYYFKLVEERGAGFFCSNLEIVPGASIIDPCLGAGEEPEPDVLGLHFTTREFLAAWASKLGYTHAVRVRPVGGAVECPAARAHPCSGKNPPAWCARALEVGFDVREWEEWLAPDELDDVVELREPAPRFKCATHLGAMAAAVHGLKHVPQALMTESVLATAVGYDWRILRVVPRDSVSEAVALAAVKVRQSVLDDEDNDGGWAVPDSCLTATVVLAAAQRGYVSVARTPKALMKDAVLMAIDAACGGRLGADETRAFRDNLHDVFTTLGDEDLGLSTADADTLWEALNTRMPRVYFDRGIYVHDADDDPAVVNHARCLRAVEADPASIEDVPDEFVTPELSLTAVLPFMTGEVVDRKRYVGVLRHVPAGHRLAVVGAARAARRKIMQATEELRAAYETARARAVKAAVAEAFGEVRGAFGDAAE